MIVAPGPDLLLAVFDQLDLPPVGLHEQLVRIAIVLDDHAGLSDRGVSQDPLLL